MNEAERCDRMSLMHAGKVLASGTPQELVQQGRGQSGSGVYLPRAGGSCGRRLENPNTANIQTPAASGKPSRQGISPAFVQLQSPRSAGATPRSGITA